MYAVTSSWGGERVVEDLRQTRGDDSQIMSTTRLVIMLLLPLLMFDANMVM